MSGTISETQSVGVTSASDTLNGTRVPPPGQVSPTPRATGSGASGGVITAQTVPTAGPDSEIAKSRISGSYSSAATLTATVASPVLVTGTMLDAYEATSGTMDNSGLVYSGGTDGVDAANTWTNSGTIAGPASYGVGSSTLVNEGTISDARNGVYGGQYQQATATSVTFNFDNAVLHSSLPIDLTESGITAHLSATGQGFSIQEANVLGFTPVGFSGYCVYPNSVFAADLLVGFSQTLTDFSILYAPEEYATDSSATMRVTAYMNGILVGTNTATATPGTWPTATLSFGSALGFNSVVVHYDSPPPTGGDYGPIFMADNMSVTPVCFCRGTLILTDRGEVAVEDLAIGDRVKTFSGAFKLIRWIGFGRDLVIGRNSLARPIIVRESALADNVPRRDLYLTHGHALYFDGVLIPVEHLVNHRSIRWDDTARVVEYYHVELADHDVLFAEGTPAESYYDAGNRAFFQNAREGSAEGANKPSFAPVLTGGEVVERVWARLHDRSGGRIERVTTDDADLHLVIDGERLDPASREDGVYTFALAASPAKPVLLSSRSAVPSLVGLNRHEHRRLGVAVRQIILRCPGVMTCFDHDAPLFAEGGCHPPEGGYSWTNGELSLPAAQFAHLRGGFTLLVHTSKQTMRYPIAAAVAEVA